MSAILTHEQSPYVLEFVITALPKMTNRRCSSHWRYKKMEADMWKVLVVGLVAARKPKVPLKQARLTLTRMSSVTPDPDGLVSGFKHVLDSLILAGIIENDRFTNIGMPNYQWAHAKPRAGGIQVRVEEVVEQRNNSGEAQN